MIVDNASDDGSAELLADCARGGLCHVLQNQANLQHGPAINQALSHLACEPNGLPGWVWVLDSDCVIARPDTLRRALIAANAAHAAVLGETQWDPWYQTQRFGTYSLLVDPAQIWRPELPAFDAGGDPACALLDSVRQLGLATVAFPFTENGYLIHRGRGSLAAVVAADGRDHPLFDWATRHHEPHYGGVPGADARDDRLHRDFRMGGRRSYRGIAPLDLSSPPIGVDTGIRESQLILRQLSPKRAATEHPNRSWSPGHGSLSHW